VYQGWGRGGGRTVTIACGQAVIVDVPTMDVTVLSVLGALMFKDAKALPRITLTAAFVIVEGRFSIRDEGETVQSKGQDCTEAQPQQAARVLVHQQATSRHYLPEESGAQGLCSGGRAGGLSRPARARQHADVDQAGGDSSQG